MTARDTIYQLGDRWLFHLQFNGTDNPEPIEMEELLAEKGRIFKMKTGSNLYMIDPNGELGIHDSEGKLLSRFATITRRRTAVDWRSPTCETRISPANGGWRLVLGRFVAMLDDARLGKIRY
jgi:hypothetical protein